MTNVTVAERLSPQLLLSGTQAYLTMATSDLEVSQVCFLPSLCPIMLSRLLGAKRPLQIIFLSMRPSKLAYALFSRSFSEVKNLIDDNKH